MTERTAVSRSWSMAAVKALLYGVALALYLAPLSSPVGIAAALPMAVAGMALASLAGRRHLRLPAGILGAVAVLLGALLFGRWVLEVQLVPRALGIRASLALSELLTFGLASLAMVFLLRLLSSARSSLSLLEVVFVAGAAVATFAEHRNRMLNRPRFFSDWAWTLGIDPGTVLVAVGLAATLAAIFLFLRGQPLLKLLTTLLLLLVLGTLLFVLKEKRVEKEEPLDALGLTGKGGKKDGGEGRGGKGKTSGSGSSSDPFKDDYQSSSEPSPVAIAILRDDFSPASQLMYFRQSVSSSYNGHHLVAAAGKGWDADLFTDFPRTGALQATSEQSSAEHLPVPTTMYLLVDHPQPLALSHAVRLAPAANPNPQQFVAAYDVESAVLSVEPQRLLGRRSVPESWSQARRAHYLALPDDPRYAALADIIARDVDPRFSGDDLARAFAVKRYLEREGFYTMKSSHASSRDPTASFLFGSLRGYCVHFAHAAVYLLRALGIASRVALGYAVQTSKRSGGSAVLIMSDRAHAWPEIYLEGIGWVTFDIYPERTDVSAPTPVDYDLEKLLGELARSDRTAGVSPDGRPLRIPWAALGLGLALFVAALLAAGYLVKIARRLAPGVASERAYPRLAYVAMLDRLSDLGQGRRRGETREEHARRISALSPSLVPLTQAHLALALGSRRAPGRAEVARLYTAARRELKRNLPLHLRAAGWLNPWGWLWTR
jgi:hypothetical protein